MKNLQTDTCDLTKIQATSRPDLFWPAIWSGVSQAAHRKEKQHWATEEPKLDNARKLRGIYFIDPDDMEFKDRMRNRRAKSWRRLWIQPCCVRFKTWSTERPVAQTNPNTRRSKYACLVEAHESTRKRIVKTQQQIVRIALLGSGISLRHYNLLRMFTSCALSTDNGK